MLNPLCSKINPCQLFMFVKYISLCLTKSMMKALGNIEVHRFELLLLNMFHQMPRKFPA
jgi:hypothetical protein